MDSSTAENPRLSKRDVITIDDDDSNSEQPPSKKREIELSPDFMRKKIIELEQKLATSEQYFKDVCGKLREAEERVLFLENIIDTKPQVIDGASKKEEELEKKIFELTAKLAQCDGLQQPSPMQQSQQSLSATHMTQGPQAVREEAEMQQSQQRLFGTQISQEPAVTVAAEASLEIAFTREIAEMKLQIKFSVVSMIESNGVYAQPIEVAGMSWKLRGVHKDKGLHFYLEAENKNQIDWCCPVFADFGVISQKSRRIGDKSKFKEFYDARDHSRCIASIPDMSLFNEKRAYVKGDSISIAVDIRAYPRYLFDATEITLRTKFNEISKLSKDNAYAPSEPTEHAGIMWKILMFKNIKDRVVFNLNALKKGSSEWACPVITDFRLISQKTGEVIHIESKKRIYDEERRTQWLGDIATAKLFNDEVGYVEDDSIMVDVVIKALPIN